MKKLYREEYPRPSFVRDKWLNLNGEWEFEILNKPENRLGKTLSQSIEVPFCPESNLSGIGYTGFMKNLWYRRTFEISRETLSGRVILHFGACDYETTVYINNKFVGKHIGGYVSFSFDITDYSVVGENTLDVEVYDDTVNPEIPSGKQSIEEKSFGCFYTRTTGIWQTVWLEFVNNEYIKNAYIKPDCDNEKVDFELELNGGEYVLANLLYKGKEIGFEKQMIDSPNLKMSVKVNSPLLWEPGNPVLYDIVLKVFKNGKVTDTVKTYCGFRKFELKDRKLYLNGKPLFLRQILDQGYYPDGIYTAKTLDELYNDIDIAMALGFNGARPHQKIFEEHYLYYADKKGYIVWGEFPSWPGEFTKENPKLVENSISEWCEEVIRDRNHPSIMGWAPLNEAYHNHKTDLESQKRIYDATKELDDRIVVAASGGHHFVTDIFDIHYYSDNPEEVKSILKNGVILWKSELSPDAMSIEELRKLPMFYSEYGGACYPPAAVGEFSTSAWGYYSTKTEDEFINSYLAITNAIFESDAIGYCYTQLTDVEQEHNGLYYYDRSCKFSPEGMKKIKLCNSQKKINKEV